MTINATGTYTDVLFGADDFNDYEWVLKPNNDPSPAYYYWASIMGWTNPAGGYIGGGYTGMQNLGGGGGFPFEQKCIIFSIGEGALDAETFISGGIIYDDFDGDPGRSTLLPYAWTVGHSYKFHVYRGATAVDGQWWNAEITDMTTSTTTQMSRIKVPLAWGGINGYTIHFTERFAGPNATCADVEYVSADFINQRMNPSTTPVSPVTVDPHYSTFGTCPNSDVSVISGGTRHRMGITGDLATIAESVTAPASPTAGGTYTVLLTYTSLVNAEPNSPQRNVLSATVPAALLASTAASGLTYRTREIVSGTPGAWSASTQIGTTRVARKSVTNWPTNTTHQIELTFAARTTAGSNDITSLVEYATADTGGTRQTIGSRSTTISVSAPTASGSSKPFISSVSPAEGAPAGGALVTLTGTDLNSLTGVKFGDAGNGTGLAIVNSTTATVTAPARAAGGGIVKVYSSESLSIPKLNILWPLASATSYSLNIKPLANDDAQFITNLQMQGSSGVSAGYVTIGLIPDCAPSSVINPALAGVKGIVLTAQAAGSVLAVRSGQPTPNPYATHDGAAVYHDNMGKTSGLARVPFEWQIGHTYRLTLAKGAAVTVGGTAGYEWSLTIADVGEGTLLTDYAVITLKTGQGDIATSSLKPTLGDPYGTFYPATRTYTSAEFTLLRVNGSTAPNSITPVTESPYQASTTVTDGWRIEDAIALDYPDFEYVVYTGPAPVITSLSPDHGASTGGTSVVITGTDFTDVTSVNFGSHPAASFVVNSSTQITAVTPSTGYGTSTVGVVVSTADGGPSNASNYTFDGITIPNDLVTVSYEITQPTADPTGGLLHKVLISCSTDDVLPPASGGVMRVAATVPSGLLGGSGATALSWRSRTVTSGAPGVWSASQNIGTTRVASKDYASWPTNQVQQIELSFIATTVEGSYDIPVAVTYVVEG